MAIFNHKFWVHVFLIIVMSALLATGCDTNETNEADTIQPTPTATIEPTASPQPTATTTPTVSPTPKATYPNEPPPLPPSFMIDFDAFTNSNDVSSIFSDSGQQMQLISFTPVNDSHASTTIATFGDQSNWNHAALNVGFWSIVAVAGLAIPVAAFAASFHNIPLQQPDGSWIWSYEIRPGGVLHSAKLHGIYIDNGIRWEMYISKQGEYEDFLWYYGESDRPSTEGLWILKNKPTDATDLLRIDWHRNIADNTGDIKYTNIAPNGPENGGYILVETTNQTPYDSFWDIFNKGQNNHTYIEWNKTSQEGRVKDQKRFTDDNWHCWDTNHRNIACP